MNVCVFGLGSMGKRRIRCLRALGVGDITGYDLKESRRKEAADLYGVATLERLEEFDGVGFDAIIVSTPPDHHLEYLKIAVKKHVPAFVEASVTLEGLPEICREAKQSRLLIAPSCTLRFHSAIKEIGRIIRSGEYGRVTNFSYHSGMYLPDWHTWEDVKDYYVSKKETGGCREIVPFELTWLVDLLGWPLKARGFKGSTMDVGAEIHDTYAIILQFARCFGTLMVDVVARSAVRRLVLNMELGQILWRWDKPEVKLYDAGGQRWIVFGQAESKAHEGYNRSIVESMYIEEVEAFLRAVREKTPFPNTLEEDIRILELLHAVEEEL